MTAPFAPGSLVSARGREWVVLSSTEPDVLRRRPLTGGDGDEVGLYVPLEGKRVRPATLDEPDPGRAGDATGVMLLFDAARLSLRSGAAPFRSLGRISVVPRPYQLVPLIMALRLDPVRLLIADDVGVGKTVEAAMIARGLLDRGIARPSGIDDHQVQPQLLQTAAEARGESAVCDEAVDGVQRRHPVKRGGAKLG